MLGRRCPFFSCSSLTTSSCGRRGRRAKFSGIFVAGAAHLSVIWHKDMRKELTLLLVFILAAPVSAEPGLTESKEPNKQCPAEGLCPTLEQAYQDCKSGKSKNQCSEFVETMRKLSPRYDCQRDFDTRPVPAIWVCGEKRRENGGSVIDEYLEFLSKFKNSEAQRYFASELFRSTLDGHISELYYEKSKKRQSELGRGSK